MVLTMNRWVGKVAVVTGASSGIGAAIAKQLVKDGLIVVGLTRRVENIETIAKELTGKKGKLIGRKTDLSVEDEIVKAFEWIRKNVGPVSIFISSVVLPTELNNGDAKKLKMMIDVNLIGLCIATREAIEQMKAEKINGHIIHINSISATALTETLGNELVRDELKIKSVNPGFVKTSISDTLECYENTDQDKIPEFLCKVKKSPKLVASDIADCVQYALSTPEHVQVHELTIKPIGEIF